MTSNDRWPDADSDERQFLDEQRLPLSQLRAAVASCPPVDVLLAFDAQILREDHQTRVGEHVRSCAWCRDTLADLTHVDVDAPSADENARMRDRIAAGLARPPTRVVSIRTPNRTVVLGLAMAAALLLVVGTLVTRSARDPSPATAIVGPADPGLPPAPAVTPPPPAPRAWARETTPLAVRVPAMLALAVRSGQAERDQLFDAFADAMTQYREGRHAEAAAALAPLASAHAEIPEFALYLGIARLFAGDTAGALAPLRSVPSSASVSADARWYEAVALERGRQPDAATTVLRGICGGSGPYQARACAAVPSP